MNKHLLSQILSKELANTPLAVDASFVFEAPYRVMRVRKTANGVRVHINLHGGEQKEWQTLYRAYYIAEYIRCLADKDATPHTLFEGLVKLDAVSVTEDTAVSPLIKNGTKGLRPLHMHCARVALARLNLTEETLIGYAAAPEVVYDKKGRAQFAAVWAANLLKTAGDTLPADLTADILFRAALLCDSTAALCADSYDRFLQNDGGWLRLCHNQNSRLMQDNKRAIRVLLEKARGRNI